MYFSKTGKYKDIRDCFCSVKKRGGGIVDRHTQMVLSPTKQRRNCFL